MIYSISLVSIYKAIRINKYISMILNSHKLYHKKKINFLTEMRIILIRANLKLKEKVKFFKFILLMILKIILILAKNNWLLNSWKKFKNQILIIQKYYFNNFWMIFKIINYGLLILIQIKIMKTHGHNFSIF